MLSFPATNWDIAASGALRGVRNAAVFGRIASQITPRLYLSDYWTARNGEKLDALGITHVVSVIDIIPQLPAVIVEDRRLHIPLLDVPEADILQYLETTTAFIIAALAENPTNKVLVHCMMGVSRSATVVCAYLVATTEMSASASVAHVQSLRGIVCPNSGFRMQLEEYSTQYVKLKPKLPQLALPDLFKLKLGGGIVSRIRSLKSLDKVPKTKDANGI